MGREYDIEKNSTFRLPLAYGNLPIQGFLVRHETMAVGVDLQVTLQSALGEGEWDGIDSLGYNGQMIASQYYNFHRGQTGETAADDFFPSDVDHPNAAFINVRLPVGMATDNDPDKLVGNYRCRKINNYDANGNVIGYGFSRNPARIAADVIKEIRPRLLTKIDWAAWVEWRDWCDALIDTVKDGVTVQVPRFELNIFFDFPLDLEAVIDYICQLTCTDCQWDDTLRFLCPIDRPDETFTFDLTQVDEDSYKFVPTDRGNRPNMVVIKWRNYDDEFYKQEDPVIVKRSELITQDGGENPLIIDAGICRKNQAERLAHFWAKMRCDATEYSALVGSWKSFPMLPGDIVKITHDIPDYTNRRFKIIEKEEHESEGLGYPYKLQDIPTNAYSDTDQTPLVLHPADERPNPFAAPPIPSLSITEETTVLNDGTVEKSVKGTLDFGEFGFPQYAKIIWTRPGKSPELYTEVSPDTNNQATFRVRNLPSGTNYFKAVAYSRLGAANMAVGGEQSVNAVSIDFVANGRILGLDPLGTARGQDFGTVPQSAITAKIDSVIVVNNDVDVLLAVSILNLGLDLAGNPIHNNSDSINAIRVEVFNQFGEQVKLFSPASANRVGGQVVCKFPRKYADPESGQCYFKIQVNNYFNFSAPVYLNGNTVTTSLPTPKVRANCPLEASGVPFSSSAIRCFYQFTSNVNLLRRKPGDIYFEYHATGISSSPYLAQGLAEYTEYEFQFESAANSANVSNIFRAFTKQQSEAAPERPIPTGINGGANPSNPQTVLDFSCISSANVETEVWVNGSLADTLSAVAPGGTISYQITSLSASTSRSVKFRHKWGSGDYSEFTEEITRSTNPTPPSEETPVIDYGEYDILNQRVLIDFTPRSGSGNFTVQRKNGYGGIWISILDLASDATGFIDPIEQGGFTKFIFYRIKRTGSALSEPYSNEYLVSIPPSDDPFYLE